MKVDLDLTKSLARGRTITLMGEKFWIPIRYEKLPKICSSYGCIVHDSGKCRGSSREIGGNNRFGVWLRTPVEGRRFINESQNQKIVNDIPVDGIGYGNGDGGQVVGKVLVPSSSGLLMTQENTMGTVARVLITLEKVVAINPLSACV